MKSGEYQDSNGVEKFFWNVVEMQKQNVMEKHFHLQMIILGHVDL